jgi:hypothetical protein
MASDKIRACLSERAKYRLMERASMEEILKEQGFQQTGACNSNSCMIEAGQLLGVSYLIAGRLSKANEITAISMRAVDVGTGQILLAQSKEYKCPFYDFIATEIPAFVRQFVIALDKSVNEVAQKQKKGLLYIESTPEGGEISIDGAETGRKTPTMFKDIEAGNHKIAVNTGKLYGDTSIVIKAGGLEKCLVALSTGFGTLRIQSSMSSLEIEIGGKDLYKTPVQLDSIEAGDYQVRCKQSGYFDYEKRITVSASKTSETTVDLVPVSYLLIENASLEDRISLDGKLFTKDDSYLFKLKLGQHTVEAEREGHIPILLQVATTPGDTTKLKLEFIPQPSTLTIVTSPANAIAEPNNAE